MSTDTTTRTYAEPDPADVAAYVVAEYHQTAESYRINGHVVIPCRHCPDPIRAAGGDPSKGWFHDGGEEACPEMDGTDV